MHGRCDCAKRSAINSDAWQPPMDLVAVELSVRSRQSYGHGARTESVARLGILRERYRFVVDGDRFSLDALGSALLVEVALELSAVVDGAGAICRMTLAEIETMTEIVVEAEGGEKPVCVAESLGRMVF